MDLRRLPRWQQYALALVVTAGVVAAAWLAGGEAPVPAWVSDRLVPALGWLAIVILLGALAVRLYGRRLSRRDGPPEP